MLTFHLKISYNYYIIVTISHLTVFDTTLKILEQQTSFHLTPQDNQRLALLCGQFDDNIRQIERNLGVTIHNRGHHFNIAGNAPAVRAAGDLINHLYAETATLENLGGDHLNLALQQSRNHLQKSVSGTVTALDAHNKKGPIKTYGVHQEHYLKNIATHDINFGIGPAGTGKTYLAVASACLALDQAEIKRILLVRPVVEAGEHLGFLPGDLVQKVNPYFRPLYDSLYDLLGIERVAKMIERQIIEIAPLAYMRGRTLNDAFIILDEAQNTTREQMKMFLTRIGFGSKVVITGDITQVDLPRGIQHSGLRHAIRVLKKLPGISFSYFDAQDVVRHPLVQAIVQAYDRHDNNNSDEKDGK